MRSPPFFADTSKKSLTKLKNIEEASFAEHADLWRLYVGAGIVGGVCVKLPREVGGRWRWDVRGGYIEGFLQAVLH